MPIEPKRATRTLQIYQAHMSDAYVDRIRAVSATAAWRINGGRAANIKVTGHQLKKLSKMKTSMFETIAALHAKPFGYDCVGR